MLLHDQHTVPLVDEMGFGISPGTEAFVAAMQVKVNVIVKPYYFAK